MIGITPLPPLPWVRVNQIKKSKWIFIDTLWKTVYNFLTDITDWKCGYICKKDLNK